MEPLRVLAFDGFGTLAGWRSSLIEHGESAGGACSRHLMPAAARR